MLNSKLVGDLATALASLAVYEVTEKDKPTERYVRVKFTEGSRNLIVSTLRELETMPRVIDSLNSWVNKVEETAADSYERGLAAAVAGNVRELLGPYADPDYRDLESW
jgi:hypothetical protein